MRSPICPASTLLMNIPITFLSSLSAVFVFFQTFCHCSISSTPTIIYTRIVALLSVKISSSSPSRWPRRQTTRTLHGQVATHRNTDRMIDCRVPRRPSLIHFIPSRLLPLSDLSRHPAHTPTHFLHSESSRSSRNTTPPLHVVRKALDGIHNDRLTGVIAASSTLIIMARPCRPFTVHVFVGPIAPLILHWLVSPRILNFLLSVCLYDTPYAD